MKRFIIFILFFLIPAVSFAAHSGDGASTITTGWSNDIGSGYYIEWTWTGDGTTLSTTIDMESVMPKRAAWYFFMVREIHGSDAADPSDHAVTVVDSEGASILVTDDFTETGYQGAEEDMPNYWQWDGGDITVSTTDIGSADTATVRLIFVK